MRNTALFITLALFLFLACVKQAYSAGTDYFHCYTAYKSCLSPSDVVVFRKALINDSHAALANYTSYPYVVCCSPPALGVKLNVSVNPYSCPWGGVLSLSAPYDAHVSPYYYYYFPYKICLTASEGLIVCDITQGSCPYGYTCVASIGNLTGGYINAHVADCGFFPYSVCCAYFPYLNENNESIEIIVGNEKGSNVTAKIYVGSQLQFAIKVSNPTPNQKSYAIKIKTSSLPLTAFTYFTNKRYYSQRDIETFTLKPYSSVLIPVTTYGFEQGVWHIYFVNPSNPKQVYAELSLDVVNNPQRGIGYSSAPGLDWIDIFSLAFFVSFISIILYRTE